MSATVAELHRGRVRRRSRSLIRRSATGRVAAGAIIAAILVVATIFGILLEQVVLAQSAFKLAELREDIATAEARREELLLEAARLESPARIEHFARQDLGMVEPPTVQYIVADVKTPGSRALAVVPAEGLGPTEPASAAGVTP